MNGTHNLQPIALLNMHQEHQLFKPKLIILSDLWGEKKTDWIKLYTDILQVYFEITFYDSCILGEIDTTNYKENIIYNQFVSGGIDRAIQNLLQQEQHPIYILGFSIGGFIAWQACKQGLKAEHLFAISSTRLRHETSKPTVKTTIVFGEKDPYKPGCDWFKTMDLPTHIFRDEVHELYKKPQFATKICALITTELPAT